MNNYSHWPVNIAAAFIAYDALRHLDITDPARMAASDRLWMAQHPGWVDDVYDCEVPF